MTAAPSAHRWTTWVKTSKTWRLFASSSTPGGALVNHYAAIQMFGESNVKHLPPIFKQH